MIRLVWALLCVRLSAFSNVRPYQVGDFPRILDFWKQGSGATTTTPSLSVLDPEGPFSIDCGTEERLQESYLEDGVFLVATDDQSTAIVGTAGLVIGTAVVYQKSGASQSTPQTLTGAVRRVCAVTPSMCQKLLQALEEWAQQESVDELIALAYDDDDDSSSPVNMPRPNRRMLENLGYEPSDIQMKGVAQYEKKLINPGTIEQVDGTKEDPQVQPRIEGVTEAVAAAVLTLALIITVQAVAQFMGLDVWSETNNLVGTPLSTQELERLRLEEGLQRTTLNDGEWLDLSPGERQEELALMKIILGQDVRVKGSQTAHCIST